MNASWLTQLAPEHAPAPPAWWPLAPGWWMVAALCVVLVSVATWWFRYSTQSLYRQQRHIALDELHHIRINDHDAHAVARAIQNLLRRYALTVFGHERVAKLSGQDWLEFMAAQGGSLFAGETGKSLLSAAFGSSATAEHREQWLLAAEAFIKQAPLQKTKYKTEHKAAKRSSTKGTTQ